MSIYNIDYSDPLRTGFSINPGEFNGPGGSGIAQTSLRLYGRGALEWGESVDENLVRLTENFAGATPPRTPVAGQIWVKQALYVKAGANFYRWNITAQTWSLLTVTTVTGAMANGTSVGSYVYHTDDSTLYRWDTQYKQAAASWIPRELTVQGSAPTTQDPVQNLMMWDEYTSQWIPPRTTSVGTTLPGVGVYDGQLFYNTATGVLYVWNGAQTRWDAIIGPANTTGVQNVPVHSNIDMGNLYTLVNLTTPLITDVSHATNVQYVTTAIQNAVNSLLSSVSGAYVPLVGGASMTGAYNVTGSVSAGTISATTAGVTGTATIGTVSATTVNGTAGTITTFGSTTATLTNSTITNLTLGGSMNANNQRILSLGAPLVGTDAATKTYVDATAAAAQTAAYNAATAVSALVNQGATKNGDIDTSGGTIKIYLGGWRQVWPPLYQ